MTQISRQIGLAAWEHELRGPGGRWEDSGALTGSTLWNSSQGRMPVITPQDAQHARAAWYGYNFTKTERYLRQGHSQPDPDIEAFVSMVASAPPLTQPAVLHRGVKNPDALFGPVGSRVGQDFEDAGLVSATTDPQAARSYSKGTGALIRIHAPAGTHALHAEPQFTPDQFTYDRHKEYTLPPRTRFRVLSDRAGPGGQRVIDLGVIV